MTRFLLLIPVLLGLATAASAQEKGQIHIVNAAARPTAPGATTGAVYMFIMNHGETDDTLTGLTTPAAEKAEIHKSVDENGVARMDAVGDLTVKANDGVIFKPGGMHIMLTGLKQPLKPGDTFPVMLTFAKAGPVTVTVEVKQVGPQKAAPHKMGDMKDMKM